MRIIINISAFLSLFSVVIHAAPTYPGLSEPIVVECLASMPLNHPHFGPGPACIPQPIITLSATLSTSIVTPTPATNTVTPTPITISTVSPKPTTVSSESTALTSKPTTVIYTVTSKPTTVISKPTTVISNSTAAIYKPTVVTSKPTVISEPVISEPISNPVTITTGTAIPPPTYN